MRVYVHLEELLGRGVPVYHVAVEYRLGPLTRRFDYGPWRGGKKKRGGSTRGRSREVCLGRCKRGIGEVYTLEQQLAGRAYVLMVNDCRHYSNAMVQYSVDEEAPDLRDQFQLWKLFDDAPSED